MIPRCLAAFLLTATMSAQGANEPQVRIFFPDGHAERASMVYGLHQPSGSYPRHRMTMPSGGSFFEIPAVTDRFKALVWAPGCKVKEFDAPVNKSQIELQFPCDPLKTVALRGRVKSAFIGGTVTVSANYQGIRAILWADACELRCAGSGDPTEIAGISTAEVAPDGTFSMELPDFNSDPIVADDFTSGIELVLHGVPNVIPVLRPESSSGTMKVAASYPAEVAFVPVAEWKDSSRRSH